MVRGIPKRRSRANNCAWSQVSVVTVCWERFEIAKNRHHHHRVIKREVRFAGLPVAVCSVLSSPYRSIGRGRLFVRSFARSGVSIQPRDFVMPLSLSLSLPPGWLAEVRCADADISCRPISRKKITLVPCPAARAAATLSHRNSASEQRTYGHFEQNDVMWCERVHQLPARPPACYRQSARFVRPTKSGAG